MKIRLVLSVAFLFGLTLSVQSQSINQPIRLNEISSDQLAKIAQGGNVFHELNTAIFEEGSIGADQEIILDTPNGEQVLRVTRVSEYVEGYTSFRAASETGVFAFTIGGGKLSGMLHSMGEEDLFFKYDGKAKRNVITSEGREELGCTHELVTPARADRGKEKQSSAAQTISSGVASDDPEEETVLDIMVVHTQKAASWAAIEGDFGGIEGEIAQAMNVSQSVLDNSDIPITLRLVHLHETDFDEDYPESSGGHILRLLTASPSFNPFEVDDGKMDEVHELRDQYGADLVALVPRITGTGGIAWRIRSRYGFPYYGFSITRVQQVISYTFIHEIGHNFGNAHSRTQETQTADIRGGVFQESVGYQNVNGGINTVMAYSVDGTTRIPLFSGADATWDGVLAGLGGPTNITDASLSMRKMKGVMSNYRKTKTDPPLSDISTDKISVVLGKDESLTVPFMINNSGASNLEYSINFVTPEGTVFKSTEGKKEKPVVADSIIFSTSFEADHRFFSGTYKAKNSWRIYPEDEDPEFSISNETPISGSNHLRIASQDSEGPLFLYSPFFGNQRYGSYKVSFGFRIPDTPEIDEEEIAFLFSDGFTENISAGLSLDDGIVYTLSKSENDTYVSSGEPALKGSYNFVDIEYDAGNEEIRYFLNDQEIASTDFIEDGNTPSEMIISYSNTTQNGYVDIDSLVIKRYEGPYTWLIVDDYSGAIKPSDFKSTDLVFDATGLESGTYNAVMVINTNEYGVPAYEVPIELVATNVVSNEHEESSTPHLFALNQNYPNPFNPSTVIKFSVPKTGKVSLKVYDLLGREVSTLVDGRLVAGQHEAEFNATGMSSGVYYYRLTAGEKAQTKKMLLIK